jgi:glutaredoxin
LSLVSRELFGAAGCPFTAELREQLLWDGEEFVEHDVEQDAAAFARLVELTGGRRGVPVLVEDGRVVQLGFQGRTCAVTGPPGETSTTDEPGPTEEP